MANVRSGLQILGSDGGMVGVVDGIEQHRLRLHSTAEPAGHYFIPTDWIVRVDDHVHLSVPAATARGRWQMDSLDVPAGEAVGTRRARSSRNGPIWIVGIIFLVVILFFTVRSCVYAVDTSTTTEQALPSADSDATGGAAVNEE